MLRRLQLRPRDVGQGWRCRGQRLECPRKDLVSAGGLVLLLLLICLLFMSLVLVYDYSIISSMVSISNINIVITDLHILSIINCVFIKLRTYIVPAGGRRRLEHLVGSAAHPFCLTVCIVSTQDKLGPTKLNT